MPPGFIEAPSYVSQISRQGSSTFLGKSTFLQHIDNLLLHSITKVDSIKDFVYLFQQLSESPRKNYNDLWTLFITYV